MLREPITVRQATVDDIPFMSEMMQEAFLASPTFLATYDMEKVHTFEEGVWQKWRKQPGPAFVAEDSAGRRLGALRLLPDEPSAGVGWVIGIGVEASARHQGVGQRLMEATIAYARTSGADYLYLMVDPTNTSAIALYRKTGFIETGEQAPTIGMRFNLNRPTP